MEMNNKSNRKLLAALVVMAVAFVALAAIPAVDAEDAGVAGEGQTEAIDTYDELSDALAEGGKVVLGGDIDMSGKAAITVDTNVELDLAGHSITKVQAEIKSNSFPMAWTIEGHRGFLRGLPGRLFGGSFGMRSSALRTSFSLSV